MIRPVLAGIAISLLAAAPAFAVGASCEAQLDQIAGLLQQKPDASAALKAKYAEAKRLCTAHQDEQAQDVARQIRSELASNKTDADAAKSGSSNPSPSSPTQPSK